MAKRRMELKTWRVTVVGDSLAQFESRVGEIWQFNSTDLPHAMATVGRQIYQYGPSYFGLTGDEVTIRVECLGPAKREGMFGQGPRINTQDPDVERLQDEEGR